MAILDDIFKKRNNNPATSFLPVNKQEVQEEANRMPDIPETKASDVEAEVINTQQQTTPAPNKWGYSDSDIDYLGKFGYTPDKLEQIANFDPAKGGNVLQHLYQSTINKPTAPDEKRMKNARLWSGIADGVGMLSQMWSAGKGAHVRERDYKNSALSQTEGKEKEVRDRYTKFSQMYDDGLLQARMKDYLKALDDHNNDKKGVQGVMAAKQKVEEAARQADAKNQFNYTKLAQDQANKDKDFELKSKNAENMDRHRKALEAQGWSRVADSKNRTSAYVKKMSSSGSGKNTNYQMIFSANPNDTADVQTDDFGNKVKKFEMNKGQIDQYARQALSDEAFMNSPTGKALILQRPKYEGTRFQEGSLKLKPNQDIAAAWIEEQYGNSFTQSPAIPPMATPPYMNWQPWIMPNMMPNYPEDGDEDKGFPIVGNMSVANF